MNIFLTGSSGFIGKNLMLNFNQRHNIKTYNRDAVLNFDEFDCIIHLAGIAHDINCNVSEDEYYKINTDLTIELFNKFLNSNAKKFIFFSSSKVISDYSDQLITEYSEAKPKSIYGKSKLKAEEYLLTKIYNQTKKIYILRPAMIHGLYNKGNLNSLINYLKTFYWPFGKFENKRSYCSIDNLCFVINEFITRNDISSGIYNIADNKPISTNELVQIITDNLNSKSKIINIPRNLIIYTAKLGDFLGLKFNTITLNKITGNFIVSNEKILKAINKQLPLTTEEGIKKTVKSFKHLH